MGTAVKTDMEDVDATCGTKSVVVLDTGVIAKTFGDTPPAAIEATEREGGHDAEKPPPRASPSIIGLQPPLNRARQIEYGAIDARWGCGWRQLRRRSTVRSSRVVASLMAWAEAFAEAETPKAAAPRRQRANSWPCASFARSRRLKRKRTRRARGMVGEKGEERGERVSSLGRGALHPVVLRRATI